MPPRRNVAVTMLFWLLEKMRILAEARESPDALTRGHHPASKGVSERLLYTWRHKSATHAGSAGVPPALCLFLFGGGTPALPACQLMRCWIVLLIMLLTQSRQLAAPKIAPRPLRRRGPCGRPPGSTTGCATGRPCGRPHVPERFAQAVRRASGKGPNV